MRDDGVGTVGGGAAGLAVRAQIPRPDVAGQTLIRQPEPQVLQFVVEGAGPQMRVLDQSRRHVVDERVERIWPRPSPHTRLTVAGQILADRFAVEAGVTGDLR